MSGLADAGRTWRIGEILEWTHGFFHKQGMASARLDAEVLLAHVLHQDRIYLYTHYDQPLNADELGRFGAMVRRRRSHEPVAYIVGHREFYGLDFAVSPAVLIPRPATEHLIEVALAWRQAQGEMLGPRLLDVGTGSGAIAITLAKQWPDAEITAVDLSADALQMAQRNAEHHGVHTRLQFLQGDLLGPIDAQQFDLIVSNPPYVGDSEALPPDVHNFEPALALRAGSDGLAVIARLCAQAQGHLRPRGALVMEMGAAQRDAVYALLNKQDGWASISTTADLQGHPRIVCANRP